MAITKYKDIRESWIKIEYKKGIGKMKNDFNLTSIYTSYEEGLVEASWRLQGLWLRH